MSDVPLEEQVLHRVEDGVSWITLNRPDAGNAITYQQRNYVIDLLQDASVDYHLRAVVLTANGKHFCTGADLRAAQPDVPRPDGAPDRPSGFVSRNIRNGAQLDCIQCGLCIDACDMVMKKIGREPRLIGYDNDVNIHQRLAGKPEIYRLIRPRTIPSSTASIALAVGGS